MKTMILGVLLIILGISYWCYSIYDDKHSDELPNIGAYFLSIILFISGCIIFLMPNIK